MTPDNYWLYTKLREITGLEVDDDYDDLIRVRRRNKRYAIYVPMRSEYQVTAETVQNVNDLSGNTISHVQGFVVTQEAQLLAGRIGMRILSHAKLFKLLEK